MVIIRLMGGLGNQLQQYALYQKFISLDRDAYLDTSWFEPEIQAGMKAQRTLELPYFKNADYREADREQITRVTGNNKILTRVRDKLFGSRSPYFKEMDMYHPEIFERDNIYLEGYWGAEKYYSDILPVIRHKLEFDTSEMKAEIRDAAEEIKNSSYPCSIHIRRGDYLDPVNYKIFGNIATEEYYVAAFEYVRARHPDVTFFIFSDDIGYASAVYGQASDCRIMDINHEGEGRYDIYLMSLCRAHICANSSFSFWGVRLDKEYMGDLIESDAGIYIRPTIHKKTQVFNPEIMKDLWRGWTFIDPRGELKLSPESI